MTAATLALNCQNIIPVMKTLFLTAFFLLLLSCIQDIASHNKLALNSDIDKLRPSLEHVVQKWEAYKNLESNLKLICSTNSLNAISFRGLLISNVKAMELYIPKPFNTKDVKKSIEGTDRKISIFCDEVHEDELDKHVVQRHVNDIMKAFGNLNQTLNRTLAHTN